LPYRRILFLRSSCRSTLHFRNRVLRCLRWRRRMYVTYPFDLNSFGRFADFSFSLSSDECLDVTQALDSCGGCASTGEGQDCTKIRGAMSMGCETSKCVVYSCEAGWKPSLAGDKCVRVRSHSSSHNSTAKRHIAARHHLSHGSL